jgi:hypothetical protein
MWAPLALIVAILTASWMSGHSPVRSAAASSVNIDGSVAADVFIDASGCTALAVNIGELVPGDPWKTAQDEGAALCAIDFGSSNHAAGTDLTMFEDPAAPAAPTDAMKCVGGSCTGDSLSDFSGGAEPANGASAFGAQLLATGGIASGTWPIAPAVRDVQDAGDTTCQTSAAGTGTCSFTFGATASSSDLPGSYQALARLLVLAR